MAYHVIQLEENLWAIEDRTVRMYLLNGGDEAALLDTGYGSGALDELAKELTGIAKENIIVLHTHSHGDHTSGDGMFVNFRVSEAEAEAYAAKCPEGADIQTIRGGDLVTVGNIVLEVLDTPGHTPGAVSFLDRRNRRLFSGDSFAMDWPIYMQFPDQNLERYLESIKRLKSLSGEYDTIYPCHGKLEITKEILGATIQCAEGIQNGTLAETMVPIYDGSLHRAVEYAGVVILY